MGPSLIARSVMEQKSVDASYFNTTNYHSKIKRFEIREIGNSLGFFFLAHTNISDFFFSLPTASRLAD